MTMTPTIAPTPIIRIGSMIDVKGRRLHAREPRVLRDRGDLGHVEQRDQVAADEAAGVRFGDRVEVVGDRLDTHARRRLLDSRPLLVERRLVDAVGEALHHQWPIGNGRKDQRRDLRVVAQQVAFRELRPRPEHLPQIRDAEPPAFGELDRPVLARVLEGLELGDYDVKLALVLFGTEGWLLAVCLHFFPLAGPHPRSPRLAHSRRRGGY